MLMQALPTLTPCVRYGTLNHRWAQRAHVACSTVGDACDVPAADERVTIRRMDEKRREALSTRGVFGGCVRGARH
jgi:hypothetical protein